MTDGDTERAGRWLEVADGVRARRHEELDLTTGLVLGSERALVIDTRGDHRQGAELAAAVRAETSLPCVVVLTHGHFDHCFGTAAFRPAPVWAHRGCAAYLREHAERQRAQWCAHYRREGRADVADALAASEVVPPDRAVTGSAEVDLGGRVVRLHHFGPAHTDHDLVVSVPDVAVVLAGDLVEQGAPPDFEDADPQHWPTALSGVLALRPEIVVPGHGAPVDAEFVRGQRDELVRLADVCARHARGELTAGEALHHSPYPADTTEQALRNFR
ncbi:MBL fold metallo-hydrolase [Saccharopolyspora gloriosae]|uniref:Glyoxylase-like metal-dependent hydrolase (Beta-lactamase superfamily II) n=1 Tax=Saccharopolyspora gloriosae TaxID=455344 RepID=A0A840N852_9PSEU|nr:glyoxylase-like metal-dependent hydrolase (beta-lactamase superfamily II) [Saccharopolyspora gloriosae]